MRVMASGWGDAEIAGDASLQKTAGTVLSEEDSREVSRDGSSGFLEGVLGDAGSAGYRLCIVRRHV